MKWLTQNGETVVELTLAHLALVIPAIVLSLLVAVPLGRIAHGQRWLRGPVLGAVGVLYAIPSLPLFILVPTIFGTGLRSSATAIIVLTTYGVAVLIRSAADAFGAVPAPALAAADAVGYSRWRRFWGVELPIAIPVLVAGLRVVSVSTVSLATIGSLTGISSLGTLFTDGFQRGISAEVVTGLALTVFMAVTLDLLLAGIGRVLTPWNRTGSEKGAWLMSLWTETIAWFLDSATWTGTDGIGYRLLQHLTIALGVLVVAAVIALPAGVLIGHRRRGGGFVVVLAGAARAVPTLGLLTLLGLALGIGLGAPFIALVILAIPPLLTGAYSGIAATDGATIDAARAIGLSEVQIVAGVELPLAAPIIVGGLRSATLQVVATTTLAAYTADAGLGRYIFTGLKSRDYGELVGGSILVVVLALLLDGLFAITLRAISRRPALLVSPIPSTERVK